MFVYYLSSTSRTRHRAGHSPQEKFPIATWLRPRPSHNLHEDIRDPQRSKGSVGSKLDAIYKQYTAKPAEVYTDEGNVHIPAL